MFDTMTMTKILGAVCGSLLVFLLGNWAAEVLYNTETGGHGEHAAQAYTIDTGEAEGGSEGAAEEGPDFATLLASADTAAGEKVFSKCKACHKTDGNDITGPHLNGVVGRGIGSVAGFGYSGTLAGMSAEAWEPEALSAFLENPKAYAPGTKMSFAGLPKPQDRANLIAWLATLN